jgi:hypothetical protein
MTAYFSISPQHAWKKWTQLGTCLILQWHYQKYISVQTSKPTPCSFGLSATSQQYFSLRTNQPPATSQQYFSLTTNQHQPSATSQTNRHRKGSSTSQSPWRLRHQMKSLEKNAPHRITTYKIARFSMQCATQSHLIPGVRCQPWRP